MSEGKDEIKAPEILIIKRHGGDHDEGHHGGAWKIAYADFMTAMMAFFLVMWLVNSTDKATLTQVATYFNPIKLTDRSTSAKGLKDIDEGAVGKLEVSPKSDHKSADHAPESKKDDHGKAKKDAKKDDAKKESKKESAEKASQVSGAQVAEANLFSDPMKALDALAAQARSGSQRSGAGGKAGEASGENLGALFRDPFDPNYWRSNQSRPAVKSEQQSNKGSTNQRDTSDGSIGGPAAAGKGVGQAIGTEGPIVRNAPSAAASERAETKAEASPALKPVETGDPKLSSGAEAEARQLAHDISRALGRTAPGQAPNIEVVATPEGLLVSLTDEFDFGMFAVGSAEPKGELVLIMERIAAVLGGKPGSIVIRGHTDGRPYKSTLYDNWRLSTARAHMASYMLVRGGVADTRIERVEGYADRKLKLASDPGAAQNRRIEILLRTPR